MTIVLFDIDGTLANVDHRRHLVEGPNKDFHAFYEAMEFDTVNEPVADLLRMYDMSGSTVYLCTGRPEEYRKHTIQWLRDNFLYDHFHQLLMRPTARRFDPDYEVKRDMLYRIRADGGNPTIAVDDRDQVVRMWRDEGLTCFQVADGDF